MRESTTANRWAIVVHGGAKRIEDVEAAAFRAGCERAATVGGDILEQGGSAIDAVVAAIRVLEDDATFNAGTGAVRNSRGEQQFDAALMDGRTLDVGAVAALRDATNPILVARAMLPVEQTLIVAEGAREFAAEHAPEALNEPTRASAARAASGGDTVGCVAMDAEGNFAAGTSTGGLEGAPPGRVGDSPLPGCGFYAENGVGGASLSGGGEQISRVILAGWATAALAEADAETVAERSLARLERVDGEGGIILIDDSGRVGWAHNSRDFAVAFTTSGQTVTSLTRKPGQAA